MPTKTAAKATLRDEDSLATPCMVAMDELLGSGWMAWEPESLWLDLSQQGVGVPVSNREQIMAARSLITTGRFWYDINATEVATISFNNDEPSFVGVEDAPVVYLAWAVEEANDIHRQYENGETLDFDREPLLYMAVQMHREGFVITPDNLREAQDRLDSMNTKDAAAKKLKQQVLEGWADAPRGDKLKSASFPETPAGVQLAKLASVDVYCSERRKMRDKQLADLGGLPSPKQGPYPV